MHLAAAIALIGGLVFLAHLFAGIFSRTRIPDVLWLLLIGVGLGPGLHLLSPAQFGVVGPAFTTVTLILILFESGLNLRLSALRDALPGTLALSLGNFIFVTLLVGLAAHFLLPLGPWRDAMLGVMLAGNSPTVVVPLARGLGLGRMSGDILFLESAFGDALSIVLALALLDLRLSGLAQWQLTARALLLGFGLALAIGAAAAFLWSLALNRMHRMENAIFTTPAFVFILYGATELMHFNGALAALAFGVVLGNLGQVRASAVKNVIPIVGLNETEKVFFGEIVFLLKTFFFVYIGLSVRFTHPAWVFLALAFSLVILCARIPAVRLTLSPSIPTSDGVMMAAMVPKGLAAAVLAAVMVERGLPGGPLLRDVTYSVIFFSVVLTAVLTFLLAHRPGLNAMAWLLGRSPGEAAPAAAPAPNPET